MRIYSIICCGLIIFIFALFIFTIVCDMYDPMSGCMRTYRDYEYCKMKVGVSE